MPPQHQSLLHQCWQELLEPPHPANPPLSSTPASLDAFSPPALHFPIPQQTFAAFPLYVRALVSSWGLKGAPALRVGMLRWGGAWGAQGFGDEGDAPQQQRAEGPPEPGRWSSSARPSSASKFYS